MTTARKCTQFTPAFNDVKDQLDKLYAATPSVLVEEKFSSQFNHTFFREFLETFLGTWIGYTIRMDIHEKKGILVKELTENEYLVQSLGIRNLSIKSLNEIISPHLTRTEPKDKKRNSKYEKFVNGFIDIRQAFNFAYGLSHAITRLNPYLKMQISHLNSKPPLIDQIEVVNNLISHILNNKIKFPPNDYKEIIEMIKKIYGVNKLDSATQAYVDEFKLPVVSAPFASITMNVAASDVMATTDVKEQIASPVSTPSTNYNLVSRLSLVNTMSSQLPRSAQETARERSPTVSTPSILAATSLVK